MTPATPALNDERAAGIATRFASAFSDASFGSSELGVVRVRAPVGLARHFAGLGETDCAIYFANSAASERPLEIAGLGRAIQVQAEGHERFQLAAAAISAHFRRFVAPPELLRFFGGAAFTPGRDGSGCWSAFGDATFILPRFVYLDHGDDAELLTIYESGERSLAEEASVALVADLRQRQADLAGLPKVPPPLSLERVESVSESAWGEVIDAIRASIAAGTLEKVVAARRTTLRLSHVPRLESVLSELLRTAPECVRFAFRIGTRTFVGATPETLVEKSGGSLRTEALAGSCPRDKIDSPARLMESEKDRAEHQFVVNAVISAIEPFSKKIVQGEPRVVALRRILHLQTPIFSELNREVHVLALVEKLHPTPAVGGHPRAAALAWIRDHETVERGWYAAPFGWIDAKDDGHFVVALRSALLNHDRVHLFAGAGIVARSDALEEYAETELKMTSMLAALGLPEVSHAKPA